MSNGQTWHQYPGNINQSQYLRRRQTRTQQIESFEEKTSFNDENGTSHVITNHHRRSLSTSSSLETISNADPKSANKDEYDSDGKHNKHSKDKNSKTTKKHKHKLNQKDFECPICYELLCEPVTLQCGHTYCYHCILRWILDKRHAKCPNCNAHIRVFETIQTELKNGGSSNPLQISFTLRSMLESQFSIEYKQRIDDTEPQRKHLSKMMDATIIRLKNRHNSSICTKISTLWDHCMRNSERFTVNFALFLETHINALLILLIMLSFGILLFAMSPYIHLHLNSFNFYKILQQTGVAPALDALLHLRNSFIYEFNTVLTGLGGLFVEWPIASFEWLNDPNNWMSDFTSGRVNNNNNDNNNNNNRYNIYNLKNNGMISDGSASFDIYYDNSANLFDNDELMRLQLNPIDLLASTWDMKELKYYLNKNDIQYSTCVEKLCLSELVFKDIRKHSIQLIKNDDLEFVKEYLDTFEYKWQGCVDTVCIVEKGGSLQTLQTIEYKSEPMFRANKDLMTKKANERINNNNNNKKKGNKLNFLDLLSNNLGIFEVIIDQNPFLSLAWSVFDVFFHNSN